MKNLLLILLISSSFGLKAQTKSSVAKTNTPAAVFKQAINYQELWNTHFNIAVPKNEFFFSKTPTLLFPVNPNQVTGMFCKMEYKIESKSKLAPRFRLGSLNYTNWMEGKGELYSRYWK